MHRYKIDYLVRAATFLFQNMATVNATTNNSTHGATAESAVAKRPRGAFTYVGYVVVSLLVSTLALELGSRVVLRVYRHFHRVTVADIAPDNPAYSGYSWARECMDEQKVRLKTRQAYFPFRIWGVTEFHGECTNNDVAALGAVRRTINPSSSACANQPKTSVWMLGGSTVYGTLIPDWGTLPSYLSRELNTASNCVEVTNLGVEAYATNQELMLLIEALKSGHIPDLVIFYDGFNDADVGTSLPGPNSHMGYQTIKGRIEGSAAAGLEFLRRSGTWQLAFEMSKPLGRKGPMRVAAKDVRVRAAATLDNYEENLAIARMLGKAYGFKICAFWQPTIIYGHKLLVTHEQQLLDLSFSANYPFQSLSPVYEEAKRRAREHGSFIFLGGIFDGTQEPLYLDWVHLNPRGNELAAREVARHIRECSE
jgi:hypothetical protein